jgi:hypothetical protein
MLQDMTANDEIEFIVAKIDLLDVDVQIGTLPTELAGHIPTRLSGLNVSRKPDFRCEMQYLLSFEKIRFPVAQNEQSMAFMRETAWTKRINIDAKGQRISICKKTTLVSAN